MALRDYQNLAVTEIRGHYAKGIKKVLLKLATGGGKTVIFSEVMKLAAAKGTPCIMAVAGRQLVDQASQRLFRESVFHGVQMANHWNKKPGALIQICSIDTINSREKYPFADFDGPVLLIIDEAHMATSPKFRKFVEQYPNAFILAVTATPYTRESLEHVAEVVVNPISMNDLISQNFLVPCRYFAPSTPDLKGVKKQNGDYITSQLEERMSTLTGDIISHWKQYAENRPSILFACNLQHSKDLVEQFRSNGISAEHIEGHSSFAQRAAAIERLRTGETKILSNVGVLCTGVDIPFVSCIIMARPTQSYNLYIQQAGRGTRICEGKRDFILLDHAGNVLKHGFITDEPEVELAGRKKEMIPGDTPIRCGSCLQVYTRDQGPLCPFCGAGKVNGGGGDREAEQVDGELKEVTELTESQKITIEFNKLKEMQKKKGYKRGWLFFQMKERYGEEIANEYVPKRKLPPWLVSSSYEAS